MYQAMKSSIRGSAIIFALLLPATLFAASLQAPVGKVILTVSGDIEHTNVGAEAHFDRDMLEALGVSEMSLETPWTEGRQTFGGVLGSKVLDAVGARGQRLIARAINDYEVEIPLADLRRYPVLFAMKQNNNYMKVRNKGPIWIIYPRETYPELDNEETKQKWVWQLKSIHIE